MYCCSNSTNLSLFLRAVLFVTFSTAHNGPLFLRWGSQWSYLIWRISCIPLLHELTLGLSQALLYFIQFFCESLIDFQLFQQNKFFWKKYKFTNLHKFRKRNSSEFQIPELNLGLGLGLEEFVWQAAPWQVRYRTGCSNPDDDEQCVIAKMCCWQTPWDTVHTETNRIQLNILFELRQILERLAYGLVISAF